MNTNKFLGSLKKIGLVLSLIFGFILLSNSSAQAQYRNDRGYGRNGDYGNNGGYGNNGRYRNDIYRIAQQNGYNDGLRKGEEDARENHNNPQGTSEYKRATNGYDSRLGNKNEYKDAYRQAFLQGFDEGQNGGYYNNGNNGRNGNQNRYPNQNRRGNTNNNAINILRQIIRGY